MTVDRSVRHPVRCIGVLLLVSTVLPLIRTAAAQQQTSAPKLVAAPPSASDPLASGGSPGGATRYVLEPDSSQLAAVDDLSELLNGRIPGVFVMRRSGVLGAGSEIRIRGRHSIMLPTAPMVFVDGIRVDERMTTSFAVDQSASPSALDQIPVEDIERVEVLPGPAAAWRYGRNGANGVLLITTKRGHRGPLRWRAFTEQGVSHDATTYPANWGSWYTRSDGEARHGCILWEQADGLCAVDSVTAYSPLEAHSPFRNGVRSEYGFELSGGARAAAFRLAARQATDGGIYRIDDAGRTMVHASVSAEPMRTLAMSGRASWMRDERRTPIQPSILAVGIESPLSAGLLGAPYDDPEYHGYFAPYTPDEYASRPTRWIGDRLTAGATIAWRPTPGLDVGATAGIDRNDSDEGHAYRYEIDPSTTGRQIWRGDMRRTEYTFAAHGTSRYAISSSLRGASTLGADYLRAQNRHGQESWAGQEGSPSSFSSLRINRPIQTLGAYLAQELVWRERLALTLGLRADGSTSAFSFSNLADEMRRSASLSWDAVATPDARGRLGRLRLHAAYGEAGTPLPVMLPTPRLSADAGYLVPPSYFDWTFGGRTRPEASRELELGADATLADGRARAGLTWYDRRTSNAFALWTPPLSTIAYFRNGARTRSSGVEGYVGLTLPMRESWTLSLAAQGAMQSSTLVSAADFRPLPTGESLDARWMQPLGGFDDANANGVIEPDELGAAGDSRLGGNSFPGREAALSARLSLGDRVSFGAMLDHRGDFDQLNRTEEIRCLLNICRALNDPTASLAEQARAVAATSMGDWTDAWVEPGDFVRLRELSITVALPDGWAAGIGARSARLSVAGRDLALWSSYSGFDPEVRATDVGSLTGSSPAIDYLVHPLPRRFVARMEVGW